VAQTEQDRLRAVVDAALGVIDHRGTGLENFVTTGLDEETIRRIDPRSVGFPDRAIGVIVA
jgi:hypothetical protein